MRAGALVAVLALAGAVAGCVLVTGGSDGYSAPQANLPGQSCQTPADCNGQPCCFESDAGTLFAACQASCPAYEQSCAVASDCGDAGTCLAQSCTIEGVTATVTTCGVISFCTQ